MNTFITWAIVAIIVGLIIHPKSRPYMKKGLKVIFWFCVGWIVTGIFLRGRGGGSGGNSSGNRGWPQGPQHW